MGKWNHSDTSEATGDTTSQAARAGHDARDDAVKSGELERGNPEKNAEPFSKTDSAGTAATGFWNTIFGKK